jgi:predicted CxxxxCH...CXXCH cytochrome family protein
VNGKVDLGDGSGTCGACHGKGADPWPATGAHAAHAAPMNAAPVACTTCHAVPGPGDRHPLGKDAATVTLAGLAAQSARRPSYDATTKTCSGTYCHEGRGGSAPAPRWTDGAVGCASCHAAPPPPPHVQSTTCSGTTCHAAETTGPRHVNGLIDR